MIASSDFDSRGCYSFKKISHVAIPILLSMLMEHIIGMTDTAFLGRVSEVALGASALGTVYFLVFFVLGSGFSFGAQILIARRNGEKNFSKIGQLCYVSGFFLLLLALAAFFFIKYFSPQMLAAMIKSPDVCNATIEYLNYRAYGLLFAFITGVFRAFYVGIAQTKILTYSSVAMVLANIVLNYALIFGRFGLPSMGIAGAATASSISEGIALFFYIFYTLRYIDLKKYGLYTFSSILRFGILKKVFAVSFWMMVQPFLSVGVWFFFFVAVEHLGEKSLAVINLVRSLSALPFIVIHAFATAANSLTSNIIGEGKIDQVWRLAGKIILLGAVSVVPMLIIFATLPELVLRIYTDNATLIGDTVNAVYVMCIATLLQIAAFILLNIVSGTGAVKVTVVLEVLSLAIYSVFVYLLVIRTHSTPAVVWTVEIVYQMSFLFFSLTYLIFGSWRNKKI